MPGTPKTLFQDTMPSSIAQLTGALVPSGKTYLPDRYAWQLAVLFHNWEYAADNLASIGSIFKDPSQDTQPAVWVQQASGGSMSTPREWVIAYILRSTAYTSW